LYTPFNLYLFDGLRQVAYHSRSVKGLKRIIAAFRGFKCNAKYILKGHMGQYIVSGNPPVEIILRKSKQARRISLRVSQLDGRVTLTLPHGVSTREAMEFAQDKGAWLRGHLAQRPESVAVAIGAEIPFEGAVLQVVGSAERRVRVAGDTLLVPAKTEAAQARVAARLVGFMKSAARDRLAVASDYYARKLGREYQRISLRDTRSRWGSCSSAGGLMYSWRLIMAPRDVLQYVAAHEVAHLTEMNHSSAFWNEVEQLMPNYRAPRQWLRTHGAQLHRYQFT
jgi:predicted metal-dependent hydrolase